MQKAWIRTRRLGVLPGSKLFDTNTTFFIDFDLHRITLKIEADETYSRQHFICLAKDYCHASLIDIYVIVITYIDYVYIRVARR